MDTLPPEKKLSVLVEITRAQHFAWRAAVAACCPDVDPAQVVERMWEITGKDTARAYLKHVDSEAPLAPQIAASIAWSSQCMGEDAIVEAGTHEGEAFLRHVGCPWHRWHEKLGLLAEDRPGCDAWFASTLESVNTSLGTRLRFETLEALPEGGRCCLRRLWVEP